MFPTKRVAVTCFLISSPGAGAQAWDYENAFKCLKGLSTEIHAPETPVVFTPSGAGIYAGQNGTASGFFVFTPKLVYFFARDEMTRSGDTSSTQMKLTVNVPTLNPPHLKMFFNTAAATPKKQISFGTANEFDRIVDATDASGSVSQPTLATALGKALRTARPLVSTDRQALTRVVEMCAAANLDFPVDMGNGTESQFSAEIRDLQNKLKPGFFTMEYWFPQKLSKN